MWYHCWELSNFLASDQNRKCIIPTIQICKQWTTRTDSWVKTKQNLRTHYYNYIKLLFTCCINSIIEEPRVKQTYCRADISELISTPDIKVGIRRLGEVNDYKGDWYKGEKNKMVSVSHTPHIPIKDRWEQVLTHSSMKLPHPPNTLPVLTKALRGQDSTGIPTGN